MRPEQRSRPGGTTEAATQTSGDDVKASLPPVTVKDWERAAAAVNGMYIAVVYVTDDKVRRYPCATLATAQRRVDRAVERGHEASVVLAELRPVHVLPPVVTP